MSRKDEDQNTGAAISDGRESQNEPTIIAGDAVQDEKWEVEPKIAAKKSSATGLNADVSITSLFKFIYNANPFYLVSAGLILYAATLIFNTANIWLETAIPIAMIAGYAVLLTVAAIFLVRNGNVWDDARSILFIILTLLFVLSAGIDQKALESPWIGLAWLGGGFLFSIIITETLKIGLKITLPKLFWAVCYMLMGLFFFYPFLLGMLVRVFEQNKIPAIRAMMFFPVIAGMLLALLVPLVRKGRNAVKNNGTPWQWPYFPWIIFVLFALAACFRTYLISISFYGGRGVGDFSKLETGFALYALTPIALAALLLLLEYSLTIRKKMVKVGAMLAPSLLFLFCISPEYPGRLYYKFLHVWLGPEGKPFIPVLLALVIFYSYSWYRKVRCSEYFLAATLFGVLLSSLQTNWLGSYGIYEVAPGAAGLLVLAWNAYRRKNSVAYTLLSFGIVGFCTVFLKDTQFVRYHGAMPINLGLFLMLLIGWFGRDSLAEKIRYAAAGTIPLFVGIALFAGSNSGVSSGIIAAYLGMLFAVSLGNCLFYRKAFYYAGAGLSVALLAVFGSVHGFSWLMSLNIKGLKALFWGVVFFLAAFLISLIKGGILQSWFRPPLKANKN